MSGTQFTSISTPHLAVRRRDSVARALAAILAAGIGIELGSLVVGGLSAPLPLNVSRTGSETANVRAATSHENRVIADESDRPTAPMTPAYDDREAANNVDRRSDSFDVARHDETIRWFNGRPIRPADSISMLVTAYSPDERSCGDSADGITASGYSVWTNGMNLVAADTNLLPFGSLVSVPGYVGGEPVPVLDRGGRIKGLRLDVLLPTHEDAIEWGVRTVDVIVWQYADGQPTGFRENHR